MRTVFLTSAQEIKAFLALIAERSAEASVGATTPRSPLGAVLVGSRAALKYDKTFRLWRKDEDGDWDIIITIADFWEFVARRAGLVGRLKATVMSDHNPAENEPFGKNEIFLDVTISITRYGGTVMEYEIVDPTLQAIKNQSGLMLLDMVNNQCSAEKIELPNGSALCCPLQLLIALKQSHILCPIKWKKHAQDFEKLNRLAEALKLPVIVGTDALIEVRSDETNMRLQEEPREVQYEAGLLEPLRKRVAPIYGLDGSTCLLEREISFKSLCKEEMFEFVELETIVLLLASSNDPDADLTLEDLAHPAELLATSNEYCSSARLFLVDNFSAIGAKLRSKVAKQQGELSAALSAAISDFVESTGQKEAFLKVRHAADMRLTRPKGASSMPTGSQSTACDLPLDVLFEIFFQALDACVIGRVALCDRFLGALLLGEHSNKVWKRICEQSFKNILADTRAVRDIQPKYDGDDDVELSLARSMDWRQFHLGLSRAAKLRLPDVDTLSKCSPRLIFCDAVRYGGKKQVSLKEKQFWAEQPCLGKEIQFVLDHATITALGTWSTADQYDDPAWKIFSVQLHCLLPSLKQIIVFVRFAHLLGVFGPILTQSIELQWQVKEDLRFYVPGDSKTDGRPSLHCSLTITDPTGQSIASAAFTDDWRPPTYSFDAGMANAKCGLSTEFSMWVWVVLLLSNCPDGKRLGKILGISVR